MTMLLEQLLRLAACGRLQRTSGVPEYWEGSSRRRATGEAPKGPEADCYPVKWEHRASIQELMNTTEGEPPERAFRLVRAARLENLALWQRYKESARTVLKARGRCAFAGSGPPATVRMTRDIETAGVLSDLDADVCEAYLWYGADPAEAFRISHEGFQKRGKGQALNFTEDMAEADGSAKPGEGLYNDCFAMLLCRVVLGQQEVRDGDGEPGNSACYDSVLHEEPGRPRTYVPSCASLVYPEYMLVYERCKPGHLVRGAEHSQYWENNARHIESLFRRPSTRPTGSIVAPGYWSCWNDEGPFRDLYPAVQFKPVIQRLVDRTWKAKYTRDRKGADGLRIPRGDPNGDMPTGLRVLKVLRNEDSEMWERYAASLAATFERRGECKHLVGHEANTMAVLHEKERKRLAPSVNEVYLFHGSSPSAVFSIAQTGFNLDLTGSATGAMFGRGAYFAESSAKADEYSTDDKDGYYQGYFAMLLCRVVLGEAQHLTKADPKAHLQTGPDRSFDSTLGDREAAVGTFREFVVPTEAQIYPEYAIIYERLYERSRIR